MDPSRFTAALLSPAVDTPNVGDDLIEEAVRRLLDDDVDSCRFSIRRPLTDEEIAAVNDCDVALVCGTNLYQEDWHSALTPESVDRITVPIVPVGVGSSAASLQDIDVSVETRQMIRAFHSRCVTGGVRDPHSAQVVARAGVDNAILTGCPVLFWSQQESLPEASDVPRRRLVLTARNWLMHRWPDAVNHPTQIELLRRILEAFAGTEIVFSIHEDWDEQLVETLSIPRESVFRSSSPADYVDLYTNPENVVFAMRLHAGMLAFGNGVPTLFVGHDTRTYSFCQMMGLPYIELFDESCADACIASLERLLAGEWEVPREAGERYRELHAAMGAFLRANMLPQRTAEARSGA